MEPAGGQGSAELPQNRESFTGNIQETRKPAISRKGAKNIKPGSRKNQFRGPKKNLPELLLYFSCEFVNLF